MKHTRIVGVSCLVLDSIQNPSKVLLIQREKDPFKGKWSLPGGHLENMERVENAMEREVYEETGFNVKVLDQQSYSISQMMYDQQQKEYLLISGIATIEQQEEGPQIDRNQNDVLINHQFFYLDQNKCPNIYQDLKQESATPNLMNTIQKLLRNI